jgi:hypothetical protein
MENILKNEWLKGNIVPCEYMFKFKNKNLDMYNINYNTYEDNGIIFKLCLNLVQNLIEKEMITFFDDIPDMVVCVDIDEIGLDGGGLCIETFHYKVEGEDIVGLDRDCDVSMSLNYFFGIENEIYEYNSGKTFSLN